MAQHAPLAKHPLHRCQLVANTGTLQHAVPWYITVHKSAAPHVYTGIARSAGYPASLHAIHNTQAWCAVSSNGLSQQQLLARELMCFA